MTIAEDEDEILEKVENDLYCNGLKINYTKNNIMARDQSSQ